MIRWLRCLLGFHCSCSILFNDEGRWIVVCDRCEDVLRDVS